MNLQTRKPEVRALLRSAYLAERYNPFLFDWFMESANTTEESNMKYYIYEERREDGRPQWCSYRQSDGHDMILVDFDSAEKCEKRTIVALKSEKVKILKITGEVTHGN